MHQYIIAIFVVILVNGIEDRSSDAMSHIFACYLVNQFSKQICGSFKSNCHTIFLLFRGTFILMRVVPSQVLKMLTNAYCTMVEVTGRFGPIPVRTPGRFGPIPFRSGCFGLGRFGPILEVGRFVPILVGRFGPLYFI